MQRRLVILIDNIKMHFVISFNSKSLKQVWGTWRAPNSENHPTTKCHAF